MSNNDRRLRISKGLDGLALGLGLIFCLYHMVMVFGVFQQSLEHYTNHVAGALTITAIVALSATLRDDRPGLIYRYLLPSALFVVLVLSIVSTGYIRLGIYRLETLSTFLSSTDMVIGFLLIISMLALTWAVWGLIVATVVSIAILYFFFGQHLGEPIGHFGYDPTYVMSYLGMGLTAGLFKWVPLSADTIFLFMVFGALVNHIHVHNLFLELGKAIGNLVRGGVAYPAVIGSAMIGSVSGNSMGNVVLTGSVTIPLMKRMGYSPSSAAAIEATASSGGQIMPPIMGLGVFLMAAFLNIPYIDAALRGTIPALLYFIGVGVAVFVLTRKLGIKHVELAVDWRLAARLAPTFVISFAVLMVLLLQRYSPNYAAFYAIVSMVGLAVLLQGPFRPSLKEIGHGLAEGGVQGAQLAVLVIAAGALAQTVEITGFAEIAYALLSGILLESGTLVALLVTMGFIVVLGTGMPTAVAYVLGVITVAPILQNLGLDRFAVHFFIFYVAVFANNTPPVALNVSVASKIAEAPFWRSCWQTTVLSATAFFLPFAFVYNPAMLDFPRMSWSLVIPSIVTVLAAFALSVAIFGHFHTHLGPVRRALFAIAVVAGLGYVTGLDPIWLGAFAVSLIAAVTSAIVYGRASQQQPQD